MLKIGDKIKTEYGEGTVIGLDILKQKYKVNVPNHGTVEVDKNESNYYLLGYENLKIIQDNEMFNFLLRFCTTSKLYNH